MQGKGLATVAKDDFTGLVGWVPTAGKHSVLVGVSNYGPLWRIVHSA
jgi:hypothetical protein